MKKLLIALAFATGALYLGPTPAFAGPQKPPEPPCSILPPDITITIAGVVSSPTACISDISSTASNGATETTLLNSKFGTNFSLIGRLENNNTPSIGLLDGIQFTMSTTSINTEPTGSFTLSWVDTNGLSLDNLPISIDFEVLIFGGNNADAYKFTGVTLPDAPNNSGTATFDIVFHNNGGNVPGLSHITVTGGNDTEINQQCTTAPNCGNTDVPEPASIALLGVSLLGLAALRRRA